MKQDFLTRLQEGAPFQHRLLPGQLKKQPPLEMTNVRAPICHAQPRRVDAELLCSSQGCAGVQWLQRWLCRHRLSPRTVWRSCVTHYTVVLKTGQNFVFWKNMSFWKTIHQQ